MESYPIRALAPYSERSEYARCVFHVFDRVTVQQGGKPLVSFIGTLLSDHPSGPSLFLLADLAAAVTGESGYFGLYSARKLR